MIRRIDSILNRVTMYRLVLYELLSLLVVAGVLGLLGVLSYAPLMIAYSAVFLFAVSWAANAVFGLFFRAPYNPESTWLTALILALIITPPSSWLDTAYFSIAFWAAVAGIGSKYILSIRNKHVFNPAAFGVAFTAFALGSSASWWVGTPALAPFALAGGLLIVRKIHRFDLWWAFMAVFAAGIIHFALDHGLDLGRTLNQSFLYAPAFFFSTVMLTEPATMPPRRLLRILYGAGIGVLFLPNAGIGEFYFTPELALLAGNVFAYLVSSKDKLVLTLKEIVQLSRDSAEFVFVPDRRLAFAAGQYLEWTLPHPRADSRGVRRYFTIASAPEDPDIRVGVKFYAPASSFKKGLASLRPGDTMVAGQLAGDFTLPRDPAAKLVFVAGGIGITPFASMTQHMLARGERRAITLVYAVRTPQDAAYREVFERAERELGMRVIYLYSETGDKKRSLDARFFAEEIPDYDERMFYISGPQGMVSSIKAMLRSVGIARRRIKTDYFPGFA